MDYRIKIAAFLSLAFAFGAPALAIPPTLVWCNNCTDLQKRAMALESPIGTTVYVGDLVHRNENAYYIDSAYNEENPPRLVKVPERFTPVAPQTGMIDALIDFYYVGTPGWQKAGSFQYPSNSINVYDVVDTGPDQNNLTDWVSRQPGTVPVELLDRLAQLATVLKIADLNAVPKTTYTITFTDGSSIKVTVDYGSTNPEYVVVANSGRDSHNNTVLSNHSNNLVRFDFSGPGNFNDFNDWLSRMGLLGYSIPVTPGAYWACTNSAAGYHCVHPY